MFSLLDVILIIIIAGFGLFGLWFGLIHAVGSLIGTVFGVYFASRWYEPIAAWVTAVTGWSGNSLRITVFIVTFIVITRIVGILFAIIEKTIGLITRLPIIHSLNRFLGFVFGLLEGAVITGISLYFIARFPIGPWFMDALTHSRLAPSLVKLGSVLWPLLPEALRILQSTVEGVL